MSEQAIINAVSLHYGIPADELLGRRRKRAVVDARATAVVLLYEHTGTNLRDLGRMLGRDRSMAYYYLRTARYRNLPLEECLALARALTAKPQPQPQD